MKAYVYGANGAAITDVAKPAPKGTQVLVKVSACGLNRADLGMTKGHVHGSAGGVGTVLGMEWAGEVAELGPDAKGVKVGDKIMGSGAAAFAEYTLADHGRLFRTPFEHELRGSRHPPRRAGDHAQCGRHQRRAAAGPVVLIQGASSGVGLMAMQIAKFKGAKLVIGSSTDAMRRGRLKEFGADLAVDSSDPGWVDQVLKATGGEGVDLIVDQVSGSVANQNLKATKVKGRIVNVGRLGGTHGDFNFDLHAARRINLYRRHLPHPHDRGNPRDLRRGPQGYLGRRWNRASCNCRSTRCLPSTISARRSSTWKPTSISARSW